VQPLNRCRTYRLLYSGLGKLVDRSLVDETCLVVDSRRVRREALPRSAKTLIRQHSRPKPMSNVFAKNQRPTPKHDNKDVQ
jgi:hypothetical protein